MMNKLFITQNTNGGVGKTEVATLLTTILDEAKMDWEYGEIDEFRKLGIWLSEKKQPLVSIKPAPDMSKELKSIEDYKRFFNPVLELLEQQVSVLDLGGSVSPKFLEWAEDVELVNVAAEEEVRLHFIAVATVDSLDFLSAVNDLKTDYMKFGDAADYTLVINDKQGAGFQSITSAPDKKEDLKFLRGTMKASVVQIAVQPNVATMRYATSSKLNIYEGYDLAKRLTNTLEAKRDFSQNNTLTAFAEGINIMMYPSRVQRKVEVKKDAVALGAWIDESRAALRKGLGLVIEEQKDAA